MGEGMNLFTASPQRPYLQAYLALLPGCVLAGIGLLVYLLATGPGKIDLAGILVTALLVFVWCGYSFAVGVLLVSLYALPMIWLLKRMGAAGPAPIFLMSLLPGVASLMLGGEEYRKFSWFLLGFGASVGISYCAMAFRTRKGATS
jgi:hypothetical protein